MTRKTLFVGSSLTNAFRDWLEPHRSKGGRDADFLNCHGGFWLRSWLLTEEPYYIRAGSFVFPHQFVLILQNGTQCVMPIHADGPFVRQVGSRIEMDIRNYDDIVFAAPTLFWDISYWHLYLQGKGLLNRHSKSAFEREGLSIALSEEEFLRIHEDRFSIAYRFLDDVRAISNDIPVWIAPSILPGAVRTEFKNGWRELHWHELRCLDRELSARYGALAMEQPASTLDENWVTLPDYLRDDHHHYNSKFVEELRKVHDF